MLASPRALGCLAAFALLATAACAPEVEQLALPRDDAPLVCAAQGSSSPAQLEAQAALSRQARVALRVELMPEEFYQRTLKGDAERVRSRMELVRVRIGGRPLAQVKLQVEAKLRPARGGEGTAPASAAALAWATGEQPPPQRQAINPVSRNNVLGAFVTLATGGLGALVWPWEKEQLEVDPEPQDYARWAPLAARMARELGVAGCDKEQLTDGIGASCVFDFVVDPRQGNPLELQVDVTYLAQGPSAPTGAQVASNLEKEAAPICTARTRAIVPLGRPGDLRATVAQLFEDGVKPLAQVARR